MRRLVLSIVMAVTVACASRPEPAPPPAGPIDPRPFLVRVADSTITLVGFAAIQSDTANVQARVALRESSPERVRYRVENARNAAAVAARFVEAAIAQGDYLREVLPITPGAKEESANYTKYWELGRAKLDLARSKSASAIGAADTALTCSASGCAATRADQMQSYIEEAAGAARDAERIVRIANIYVAMAVNYVRSSDARPADTAGIRR
jgi:hypothetical protein